MVYSGFRTFLEHLELNRIKIHFIISNCHIIKGKAAIREDKLLFVCTFLTGLSVFPSMKCVKY